MRRLKLAPSILDADFTCLGEQIKDIEISGAEYIHADVMDGHFVPNISFGLPIIKSIRPLTDMVIDVHLMIDNPMKFVSRFADVGADIINFHLEACDPGSVLKAIKDNGKKAGLTIKPATPADKVIPFIDELDLILIMSVEPGFGNQKLIPESLRKAHILADYVEKHGLGLDIEMDGGINLSNVREVIQAGVNVIVAGSAIFRSVDPKVAVGAFMDIFKSCGIN